MLRKCSKSARIFWVFQSAQKVVKKCSPGFGALKSGQKVVKKSSAKMLGNPGSSKVLRKRSKSALLVLGLFKSAQKVLDQSGWKFWALRKWSKSALLFFRLSQSGQKVLCGFRSVFEKSQSAPKVLKKCSKSGQQVRFTR